MEYFEVEYASSSQSDWRKISDDYGDNWFSSYEEATRKFEQAQQAYTTGILRLIKIQVSVCDEYECQIEE
jgi:hypothetical protein